MKRNLLILLSFSALLIPNFLFGMSWQIDPDHSSFGFKVRHLMVSNVKGDFGKVIKGFVFLNDQDISSTKSELVLDVASVNTGHAKRDEHLRGPDFFDATKFPTITFVTKQVTRVGPDRLKAVGDLTIRGVTKEVVLDVQGISQEVKDPWGNFRRGLTATTKISRRDFGIAWNRMLDTGGVVVGDEVDISVELELVRK
ncbi:MAG: protein yceI precursor [Deltaproteobacteria bacterium RBG_16_49_23]|nr:MAG: protein yceI precursor [Deltaproteobacteria bacterium RBG_16_49_23]